MEMKIREPRNAEDPNEAPLNQGSADLEVQITEGEKLSDQELTLIEHSEKLLALSKIAARADALDRAARSGQAPYVNLPVSLSTSANSIAGAAGLEMLPSYINAPILFTAMSLSIANLRQATRGTALPIPDGNTIQCLRIANHSDHVREGKVLLAVHPRGFGTGKDAAVRARQSLADALEVIGLAHTMAKDENHFGGVVVAGSVARHAGLNLPANYSYKEVIGEITEEPANVPYDEAALVLPMGAMAELVERLRQNPDVAITRVLEEIAKQHSGMRQALVADNPAITSVLHGVLQRIAYAEGRSVRWEEDTETINGREIKTGARYKVFEDIMPMLDTRNPYNPRIIYRSGQTGQERLNHDLRSATGGELAMADLMRQLDEGRVDDLKLVRMALQLIEAKQTEIDTNEANTETGGTPDERSDPDQDPKLITLGKGVDKWKHRRRHAMRLAMGSAALFGVIQAAALGISAASSDDTPHNNQEASQMFRVENHGLAQSSQYWARATGYDYYNGSWLAVEQQTQDLVLPYKLKEPQPHLTVKTTLDIADVALPIEEGTQLAALRVYDKHKEPIDVRTYRTEDGVVIVDGNDQTSGTYLEYDLVASKGPSVHATRPLTAEGMYKSEGWKDLFDNASEGAKYIRDNFTYDNGQAQKDELAHVHGPGDYADHLFNTERCQCLQCNTQVGLMESQVRPDQKLALVSGYLHPRRKDETHSYLLEEHAWLNNGKTIDATATRIDENSHVPKYDDTATMDAKWKESVAEPLAKAEKQRDTQRTALWSLVGLAAVGLATIEARFRPVRRAASTYLDLDRRATAAMDIHPADARQLMGWQAYGQWAGRIPEIGENSNRDGAPKEENIPTQTLQEVARGEFTASGQLTREQQRGLRRTAKAMLESRKRQSEKTA